MVVCRVSEEGEYSVLPCVFPDKKHPEIVEWGLVGREVSTQLETRLHECREPAVADGPEVQLLEKSGRRQAASARRGCRGNARDGVAGADALADPSNRSRE